MQIELKIFKYEKTVHVRILVQIVILDQKL